MLILAFEELNKFCLCYCKQNNLAIIYVHHRVTGSRVYNCLRLSLLSHILLNKWPAKSPDYSLGKLEVMQLSQTSVYSKYKSGQYKSISSVSLIASGVRELAMSDYTVNDLALVRRKLLTVYFVIVHTYYSALAQPPSAYYYCKVNTVQVIITH